MNTTLDLSELNARIGELIMAGIPGPNVDDGTEALISDYNLGGIILFSRNIQNPLQLAKLCGQLQDMALKNHGCPLSPAVDQEGGRVARLKEPFTLFEGNSAIGEERPAGRTSPGVRGDHCERNEAGRAQHEPCSGGGCPKRRSGKALGRAQLREDPEAVALLGER